MKSHLQQYKNILDSLQNLLDPGEDLLHAALSLLQTLGEFLILMEDNDSMIALQCQISSKKLREASTVFTSYKTLYLESQALQQLELLFSELENSKCCYLIY